MMKKKPKRKLIFKKIGDISLYIASTIRLIEREEWDTAKETLLFNVRLTVEGLELRIGKKLVKTESHLDQAFKLISQRNKEKAISNLLHALSTLPEEIYEHVFKKQPKPK